MFDLIAGPDVLARTPHVLRALLHGLDATWLDANEGPDTWSPMQVVAHLINAEQVNWMPRARFLLEHGATHPFPSFDQSAPLGTGATMPVLLDEFARHRAASLDALASWQLGPDDLARPGLHPALGAVSLGQLLAAWVAHDLAHLAQIARVMAKQYRDAVGPWRTYLRIMNA